MLPLNPPPLPICPIWGVQGRCGSIGASELAESAGQPSQLPLYSIFLTNLVFYSIFLINWFSGKPDLRYTTINLLTKSFVNFGRGARARCGAILLGPFYFWNSAPENCGANSIGGGKVNMNGLFSERSSHRKKLLFAGIWASGIYENS